MKDYRATFDISDADWKAIDKALSLLEEKFMALRDITDEDRAWQVPFSTRAEAFCRKAVDVMVKDRDVLIDTDVDLDEIRGDLLSIDELRPRISRLESLLEKCRDNETWLKGFLFTGCIDGYVVFDLAGRAGPMKPLHDAMSFKKPGLKMPLVDRSGKGPVIDPDAE